MWRTRSSPKAEALEESAALEPLFCIVYIVIYAFDGAELLIAVVRIGRRREVYR